MSLKDCEQIDDTEQATMYPKDDFHTAEENAVCVIDWAVDITACAEDDVEDYMMSVAGEDTY